MQDNLNYSWKQTTADLYKAVKIYTFAAIAATIFGFIGSIGNAASALASLAEGNLSGGGFGFWDALEILATVALVYGYWLFIKSLDIFKGQVNPADAPRIGSIRTATILSIVGAIVACIPLLGFVGDQALAAGSSDSDTHFQPESTMKKATISRIVSMTPPTSGMRPTTQPMIPRIMAVKSFDMPRRAPSGSVMEFFRFE